MCEVNDRTRRRRGTTGATSPVKAETPGTAADTRNYGGSATATAQRDRTHDNQIRNEVKHNHVE
jgi:hypothetical protein